MKYEPPPLEVINQYTPPEPGISYLTHSGTQRLVGFTESQLRVEVDKAEQRGRDEMKEMCSQVCDARVMGDNNREDQEAKRCAAAIRSLK